MISVPRLLFWGWNYLLLQFVLIALESCRILSLCELCLKDEAQLWWHFQNVFHLFYKKFLVTEIILTKNGIKIREHFGKGIGTES